MERLHPENLDNKVRVYRAASITDMIDSRRAVILACLRSALAIKAVTDDRDIIIDSKQSCVDHDPQLDSETYKIGKHVIDHYTTGFVLIHLVVDHPQEPAKTDNKIIIYDPYGDKIDRLQVNLPKGFELQEYQKLAPYFNPTALVKNSWESSVVLSNRYSCKGDIFTLMNVNNPLAFKR